MESACSDCYIIGRNKYGLSMAKMLEAGGYTMLGFIDDYCTEVSFGSWPVVSSGAIGGKYAIFNCVVEGRTIDTQGFILTLSPQSIFDYFALQACFPQYLPEIDFLEDTESIEHDWNNYIEVYNRLEDARSKIEYERVLNFRYNRDIRFLKDFSMRLAEQYFEPFLALPNEPVFIDGGGFDGSTTLGFVGRHPAFRKVHYFEPNPAFFNLSKKNLESTRDICWHNEGLWDSKCCLSFNPELNSASKLDILGSIEVPVTTIDLSVSGQVDFIKLDIEGAELEALKGAEGVIRSQKPVMAVCIYHRQRHFYEIPLFLMSQLQDYKVFIRHYTQGVFETVMYFTR